MKEKERLEIVYKLLDENTPKNIVFIQADEPWKFLFLIILSAQTTDKQVMRISDELFTTFNTLEDFKNATESDIENKIKSIGFYHNKARMLKSAARYIIENCDKKIPDDIESLIKIPGVGRKSANCVVGTIYNKCAIIVDTHFLRCSNRLGFTKTKDVKKIEEYYKKNLESEKCFRFSMSLNYFARSICKARGAKCEECFLKSYCKGVKK